jgi:hypothetical protein
MMFLARWIEHPLDVTVQGSHHADAREHRRPIVFGNQHERYCSLPFLGILLCFRQLGDVERRVAKVISAFCPWAIRWARQMDGPTTRPRPYRSGHKK